MGSGEVVDLPPPPLIPNETRVLLKPVVRGKILGYVESDMTCESWQLRPIRQIKVRPSSPLPLRLRCVDRVPTRTLPLIFWRTHALVKQGEQEIQA
jgi:hypothetical protein